MEKLYESVEKLLRHCFSGVKDKVENEKLIADLQKEFGEKPSHVDPLESSKQDKDPGFGGQSGVAGYGMSTIADPDLNPTAKF
jgi:hypothetical protein